MSLAFRQLDDDGRTTTAVWAQADGRGLLFRDSLHVNTDGTKRSYSVSDFWGTSTAINNLCNAMSDACAGMDEPQLRARRVLTQDARAKGWPTDLLAATQISSNIIPFRGGKPCPEVDGFLVSATALHKRVVNDVCDISNYLDALSVPALVLPGRARRDVPTEFENRAAKVGDLAAVMTGDGSKIVLAVVGDTGPAKQIGEGSVALNGTLLGKSGEPANYLEIRGKPPFRGRGWDVPSAVVLIFPNTRDSTDPYMTNDRIKTDAGRIFEEWGGIERLKACNSAYKRN